MQVFRIMNTVFKRNKTRAYWMGIYEKKTGKLVYKSKTCPTRREARTLSEKYLEKNSNLKCDLSPNGSFMD